jgi:raffinose/stachyose/melibiose transport system substrate-binding protein
MMRLTAILIVAVLAAGAGFAGGAKEDAKKAAPAKQQELRFMIPTVAGDPAWTVLNARAEDFGKKNPNVKVIIDSQPSAQLRTKITVEMAAGNPPSASWCILSYSREFMKDNKIVDWKPIYADPRHKEFREWYNEADLSFSAYKDGRIMSVPHEASQDGFFYNKEIFAKNGWQPPKTFDDLIALAKKAREKGIYLMVTGGKDIRFAWQASALLMRTTSLQKANDLAMGASLNKWNDPAFGFPQAMQKFDQLVKAEAYPPGVLGFSVNEADQFFARGEAAMYFEGAWKPGNFNAVGGKAFVDKIGRVDFPVMPDMPEATPGVNVGGTIVGYIIAANQTKDEIENCVQWLKVVVDPQYWKDAVKASGAMQYLPACKLGNFDWSVFPAINKELYEAFQRASAHVASMDAWAPPPVDLAIKKTAMPGLITKEFTAEKAIAEVQKAAEEYLKTAK